MQIWLEVNKFNFCLFWGFPIFSIEFIKDTPQYCLIAHMNVDT